MAFARLSYMISSVANPERNGPSNIPRQGPAPPWLFGATILSSACLLFLVQPLASKLILPTFGGSSAIWITCLLFFQAGLLLGYLYAYLLVSRVRTEWQARVHLALLVLSLASLPITPSPRWQPSPGE